MSVKREWTVQSTSSKEGTFWTGTMCSPLERFSFYRESTKRSKERHAFYWCAPSSHLLFTHYFFNTGKVNGSACFQARRSLKWFYEKTPVASFGQDPKSESNLSAGFLSGENYNIPPEHKRSALRCSPGFIYPCLPYRSGKRRDLMML